MPLFLLLVLTTTRKWQKFVSLLKEILMGLNHLLKKIDLVTLPLNPVQPFKLLIQFSSFALIREAFIKSPGNPSSFYRRARTPPMLFCLLANNLQAVQMLNEANVGLVIHFGDWVSPFILHSFKDLRMPMKGVFGNNDGDKFRHLKFSQELKLDVAYEDRFLELCIDI